LLKDITITKIKSIKKFQSDVDLKKINEFKDIDQAGILVDEETIFGNVCLYKLF
jgi:hypothetical protein